ncbi:cytochrome b [Asticcacaulis biprosthecium C19]|uniref:Cytochrome b n=1 Tax=Asticcacaulis biprosthecium C19 TaxID=715226 RepID=F4QSI9_9CAUL|nr:cytochrome b N-terminal domain-containing protein [Asticcacaulis biprosthecium]EGF89709.1 cytochrome b [Asticcacaulis biprosthecium C19]
MSDHPSTYTPKSGIEKWLDARLPILRLAYDSFVDYPTPKNLNYWWTFGGILSLCLGIQIISGIVLAMHYVPHIDHAFDSLERIRRDVNGGWLIQFVHSNGASMFFFAVYIHMFRGLYYGSYKAPREVLWLLGCVIYFLMIATAFMGYVLPWGQMSYYGAVVITNLIGAIPLVGPSILTWLQGGFSVDQATLNRFFSLHYLLPFVIAGVVVLHVWALHVVGQNNPTGVEIKSKEDTVPFTPYATVKDAAAMILFLMLFSVFVFFMPDALGHADNYVKANPLQTPAHIVPEWYMLPFYAILRAIPDKLIGVIAMFAAIAVIFALPWLDTSKVKSMRYRPVMRWFFVLFVITCCLLGWCGGQLPEDLVFSLGTDDHGNAIGLKVVLLSQILTAYYFAFFLIIMPWIGLKEEPLPVPASISEAVLANHAKH